MNLTKTLAIAFVALAAMISNPAQAKSKIVPSVYMFGFAASFADSLIYFTDIQRVDSAWMDSKSKFLLGRENYSLQLKHHLATQLSLPNRTCIVVFGKKRKDVEKKFLKMKRLYTVKSKGAYDVRYLDQSTFRFQRIDMGYTEEATPLSAPSTDNNMQMPAGPPPARH